MARRWIVCPACESPDTREEDGRVLCTNELCSNYPEDVFGPRELGDVSVNDKPAASADVSLSRSARIRIGVLGTALLAFGAFGSALFGWRFFVGALTGALVAIFTVALQEVGFIPTRRHNDLTCPFKPAVDAATTRRSTLS